MVTMPKEITAGSGMDALGHAIESFVSTESSPITDSLALGALKLILTYLSRAVENGNDLKAREQMMYAAFMSAMAYNNAGVGYTHALGHQLGGFYNQFHGNYEAILLPHVFEFNSAAVPEDKILQLAEAMGETASSKPKAVEHIMKTIQKLGSDIAIPDGLKKMGVLEDDLNTLAQNALKDIAGLTNPRQGTLEDVINIYKAAM